MNNQSNSKVNWIHIGVTVLLSATVVIVFFTLSNRISPAPIVINPAPTLPVLPTSSPEPLSIFVNGAVNAAGIYELPPDSRVDDAVEAAGGFSADAYTNNINLAATLSDGMQLFVSTQEQATSIESDLLANPLQSDDLETQSGSSSTDSDDNERVDINTASQAQLETIPGVGPATAKSIMAYREEEGLFVTIEDIMNVPGIGEGKFEDMQDFITVQDE